MLFLGNACVIIGFVKKKKRKEKQKRKPKNELIINYFKIYINSDINYCTYAFWSIFPIHLYSIIERGGIDVKL